MKTLIVLIAFFAIDTAVSAQTAIAASNKEVKKAIYSCPIHPEIVSSEKGNCSKCGTPLTNNTQYKNDIPTKSGIVSDTTKVKYVCPMDGYTSDKPGKCPKCGMTLVEKKDDMEQKKGRGTGTGGTGAGTGQKEGTQK